MRIVAAFALLLVSACTEPRTAGYFEGNVTSIFITKDVFTISRTTLAQMTVVKSETDVCQQADVTVTKSTTIVKLTSPAIRLPVDSLKTASVVRVAPGTSVNDVCPTQMEATSIGIVR